MASKSQYRANEKGAEISELLEVLERLIDRTKVLYEQYFMGIQKVAPAQLHRDIERKIRELTQHSIRNTALRYRLTTLTQKFGAYNTYWRRTLREIEQGRYIRDLKRVRRNALRRGEDVPEELVAAMPKLMRERIRRDRELLSKKHDREQARPTVFDDEETRQFEMPDQVREARPYVHAIESDLLDEDFDQLFAALTASAEDAVGRSQPRKPHPAAPASAPPAVPLDDSQSFGLASPSPPQPPPAPQRQAARLIDSVQSPRPAPGRRLPLGSDAPPAPTAADRSNRPIASSAQPSVAVPPSGPLRKPRPFTPGAARPGAPVTPSAAPPGEPDDAADAARGDHTRPGWDMPARVPPRRPPPPPPRAAERPAQSRDRTQVQWQPSASDPRRVTTIGPRIGRSGAPPPGMTEGQARALYQRYIQARKMVGESTEVPYERLVKTLSDQTSRIMATHKATSVDFKVVIKNDKVVLKAKPKR